MEWYEADVRALEAAPKPDPDSHPPVFYGSSSIRMWATLAEDVGPAALNLGFGGSTLEACVYFFDRLIPSLRPRSLTLYAGDNDLGDGRSPEQVLNWYRSLTAKVESSLDGIPFGFISIKPSPARRSIIERIRKANEFVRTEIARRPASFYVDVFPEMLAPDGEPRRDLYLEDGLHLSAEGYRVWKEQLRPFRNRIFTDLPSTRNADPIK